MAFDTTYVESIQNKHLGNVGFTSTAKGVTNEANVDINPHQLNAYQIPAQNVVSKYGPLTASGIAAGVVEEHIVKLTADPTVNNNKAWLAYESNCTTSGHSARGAVRLSQFIKVAETQYKLRLFEDNGAGTAPNYAKEIFPSETTFNWDYNAGAGTVYFDSDPSTHSKILPLWGIFYTYIGDTIGDVLDTVISGGIGGGHTHYDVDFIYDSGNIWVYDPTPLTFLSIPDGLVIYVNGVKNRSNDASYYTPTISGGKLYVAFNYTVNSTDWWVNGTYAILI
jgi:hypothetical protein